jgi:hypothetical protein
MNTTNFQQTRRVNQFHKFEILTYCILESKSNLWPISPLKQVGTRKWPDNIAVC